MDGDIVIADTAEDQTAGKCVELFDVGNRKVLAGLHTIAVRGRIKFGTGYLGYYLSSPAYRKQLLPQMQGTKVISISKTALTNTVIASPCLAEQTAIGALLRKLDVLIAAEKRKLNLLRTKKSGLMQEIFSQKVRFKGYQKEWKRYRMKDISYIERGASPRPISKYTTTDKSGLNWVKIGDAPSLGNVITSTSERIKPKGLPKTRSVHPGDLILSNSMSFGRPYIMGIDGCIHDGWLLIRTNRSKVNPSFLCQALGSQFMISQYRRLAAGSAVNNLNKSIVGNAVIMIPSLKEQNAIEKLLSCYDKLIAAENQKVNILVDQKKALLERMLA